MAVQVERSKLNGPGAAQPGRLPGKPSPDFTLPTAEGEYLSLQELRGRRVILVFLRHFA